MSQVGVALQMHAAMFNQARATVGKALKAEDVEPSEADRDYVEIGIGAGIHAAMQVLVDMGFLVVVDT